MTEALPKNNGGNQPSPTVDQILRDYAPKIYNLARRMLGSDSDAEDVTQEVLLTLFQKLPSFRGESALGTWIYRITVNAALRYRDKRARWAAREVRDPLENFLPDGHHLGPVRRWSVSPDAELLNEETHRLIEAAIAELPEMYRDVYVLADVEGLPNEEIAELLGLSLSATKSRLHRARLFLRNALAPHFEEAAV
jgi:RNA polymerase sigma-70 factor (ECF subfamily)